MGEGIGKLLCVRICCPTIDFFFFPDIQSLHSFFNSPFFLPKCSAPNLMSGKNLEIRTSPSAFRSLLVYVD